MKIKKHIKPATMIALLALGTSVNADNKPVAIEKTQQELDAVNQSQQGLEIKTNADGSRSIDLKGRFQMHSVAKMVDGKVVYSCQGHDSDKPHSHQTKTAVERGVQ